MSSEGYEEAMEAARDEEQQQSDQEPQEPPDQLTVAGMLIEEYGAADLSEYDYDDPEYERLLGASQTLPAVLQRVFGPTHGVCNKQWGHNEIAYRCLDCQKLEVTAFCPTCFLEGGHEDHRYVMYMSSSGGSCDCGMSTAMDTRFCCPNHSPQTPDTGALERDIAAGKLDALRACFKEHLRFALTDHRPSIQFLQEMADLHWALRCMIWRCVRDLEAEQGFDWVERAVRLAICSELRASITVLLVSLIPTPEMKARLTRVVMDKYHELSELHKHATDVNEMNSEHLRLTVQIFSSPGELLPYLLERNLLRLLLDNLARFMQPSLCPRPHVQGNAASAPATFAAQSSLFTEGRFWPLAFDIKDYIAYDHSVARDFLTNPETVQSFADLCTLTELADVNIRKRDMFVLFESDRKQTYNFFTFYSTCFYTLTCHAYFFLWSPAVQEELAAPDATLTKTLVATLCTCYAALRTVLEIPFAFPSEDVYTTCLPFHRHIAVILGAICRHASIDQFKNVLAEMGKASSSHPPQSPIEVVRALSVWPLRIFSARARQRIGLWKRNGAKPHLQMLLYTSSEMPNVVFADLFLVQLCAELEGTDEYISRVQTSFLHDTPWLDVLGGDASVDEAMAGVDELDRLSFAALLTDMQRFLLLSVQDNPIVTGNFQTLIDHKVQSFLALGRQKGSSIDAYAFRDPQISSHAAVRAAIERVAEFHPATVSHGNMREGYFEMKKEMWADINWPLIATLATDLRKMNNMIDNFNTAMKLPGDEVTEYHEVRTGSIMSLSPVLASPAMLSTQLNLLRAMLSLKGTPSYSPSVVGACLSFIAASVFVRSRNQAARVDERDDNDDDGDDASNCDDGSGLSDHDERLLRTLVEQMMTQFKNTTPLQGFLTSLSRVPALREFIAALRGENDEDSEESDGAKTKKQRKRAKKRQQKLLDKMLQQSTAFMKHRMEPDSSEDESDHSRHHSPDRTEPVIKPRAPKATCVVCQRSITTQRGASMFGIYSIPVSEQCQQHSNRELLQPLSDAREPPESFAVGITRAAGAYKFMQLCQHYIHDECKGNLSRCPICQSVTDLCVSGCVVPKVLAHHHCLSFTAGAPRVVNIMQQYRMFGAQETLPVAAEAHIARDGEYGFSSDVIWWLSGRAIESAQDDPLQQAWLRLRDEAAFLHYLSHTIETTVDAYQPSFSCKYFLYKTTHIGMQNPEQARSFMQRLQQIEFRWLNGGMFNYRTPLELDTSEFCLTILFGAFLHYPLEPADFGAFCRLVLAHAVARQSLVSGIESRPIVPRPDLENGLEFLCFTTALGEWREVEGIRISTATAFSEDPRIDGSGEIPKHHLVIQIKDDSPHEAGPFVIVLRNPSLIDVQCCYVAKGLDKKTTVPLPFDPYKIGKVTLWPAEAQDGPISKPADKPVPSTDRPEGAKEDTSAGNDDTTRDNSDDDSNASAVAATTAITDALSARMEATNSTPPPAPSSSAPEAASSSSSSTSPSTSSPRLPPSVRAAVLGRRLACPSKPFPHVSGRAGAPVIDRSAVDDLVHAMLTGDDTKITDDEVEACKRALDNDANTICKAVEHALRLLVVLKCTLYETRLCVPESVRCDSPSVVDMFVNFLDLKDTFAGVDWSDASSLRAKLLEPSQLIKGWLRAFAFRKFLSYEHKSTVGCAQELPSRHPPEVPRLLQPPPTFQKFHAKYSKEERVVVEKAVCLLCGDCYALEEDVPAPLPPVPHTEACCPLYMQRSKPVAFFKKGERHHAWGTFYLDEHDEEDRRLIRGRKLLLNPQRLSLLHEDWLRHRVDFPPANGRA
ncbi:hypothetical protein PTSG_01686 [Salpingoeca rosetta]|uniref:E3 ubiquitin-protein ligase n=1 Tax=Salpingoeca rosetta (strain ATCC 50818 / BSB-021) TaxID=946362 RepID=F2TYN3_SALR5|nr:uncharacterized protein PTSG_01686 [Salpingoeca rosetta]EGD78707.1 hypothetical protein PTSG_01686 [Salpingoeca rosetta]|eukprot:XP_004997664.1 hypothetical protein PTSG_01686 [Salpingoeca rosetta]